MIPIKKRDIKSEWVTVWDGGLPNDFRTITAFVTVGHPPDMHEDDVIAKVIDTALHAGPYSKKAGTMRVVRVEDMTNYEFTNQMKVVRIP